MLNYSLERDGLYVIVGFVIFCWFFGVVKFGYFFNFMWIFILYVIKFFGCYLLLLWYSFIICIENFKDVFIFDIIIIFLEIFLKESN